MQQPKLANYHTHTALCQHASGTEEEYIQMAIRNGFDILGFSDHAPLPTDEAYLLDYRMHCDELSGHIETLKALREKYADQIKIYIGFEMEHFPHYYDWLNEQMEQYQLDYLVLGHHFDLNRGDQGYFGAYTDTTHFRACETTSIAAMESGMFRVFAHPDLFLNNQPRFDKACAHTSHVICEAAAALGMPLEYNLLGLDRQTSGDNFSLGLGYTRKEFWDIAAKYNVKAIIGCDAHAPEHLDHGKRIIQLKQQLRDTGVDVLDTLEGLE